MDIGPGTWITPAVRLVRPLDAGGMATVWVAAHMKLHTQVAVKLLAPHLHNDDVARARFRREGRLPAEIQSPYLVQVYDRGELPDGTPFMVMEWLEGETLKTRLAREGRLPPRDTASVITQLCNALQKTHAGGIVHRDIKPENIWLLRSDDAIVIKVLDFGVAKRMQREVSFHTQTNETLGTPKYMSPEQLRYASRVDYRTDLWSVAVVTYRLLLGVTPFARTDYPAMCLAICQGEFALPSSYDPRWPPDLDAWFTRAFRVDRETRFRAADEEATSLALALSPLGELQPDGSRTPELEVPNPAK